MTNNLASRLDMRFDHHSLNSDGAVRNSIMCHNDTIKIVFSLYCRLFPNDFDWQFNQLKLL